MYSPSRKVRASLRRTLYLLLIGFIGCLLLVDTIVEIGRNSKEAQYLPTRSAGLMLNRSQMLLAKEILLEPTLFTCQPKLNINTSLMYPLYIVVKTGGFASGEYFHRRMFTRTSWGKDAHKYGIPVIYAVGRAKDEQTQKMLENEHKTYGDILQFNYIDAYYNISIKSTGILNWFVKRGCQHITPYLFTVDDDVLINIPFLLKMISNSSFNSNTLYGVYLNEVEPHPTGKWAVSLIDYPNRTFPAFITGASTLYPSSTVNKLVERIFALAEANKPMFFLDDVLITGIIAEQLGIQRAPLSGIEYCSATDLSSRIVISECDTTIRRTYVWWKYVFLRYGQNTYEIDRLINTTINIPWQGNFKHMRNGTAIIQAKKIDKSILIILSGYHAKISFLLLFIILFVFIAIFIPKLILSRQSTTKLPLTSSISSSSSNSLKLLAPIK